MSGMRRSTNTALAAGIGLIAWQWLGPRAAETSALSLERRSGRERRTGLERRRPRSAVVERVGAAANRRGRTARRSGADRRAA